MVMGPGHKASGGGGEVDIIRLTVQIDDHTYIYQYPPDESLVMLDVLAEQTVSGRIPYIAAHVLSEFVMEGVL